MIATAYTRQMNEAIGKKQKKNSSATIKERERSTDT